MHCIALIPARGGSKGIKRKNCVDLHGKPLIAWTIDAAKAERTFASVVVSTDDAEIANIASQYGATALDRPPEFATDDATALDVVRHAFDSYADCDVIAYLQPTSPFRRARHLAEATTLIHQCDTVVSVMPVPHRMVPGSLMRLEGNHLEFMSEAGERIFQRQRKETLYARNGPSILMVKRETVEKENSLYGARIMPLMMDSLHSIDIDTMEDLEIARALCPLFLAKE